MYPSLVSYFVFFFFCTFSHWSWPLFGCALQRAENINNQTYIYMYMRFLVLFLFLVLGEFGSCTRVQEMGTRKKIGQV